MSGRGGRGGSGRGRLRWALGGGAAMLAGGVLVGQGRAGGHGLDTGTARGCGCGGHPRPRPSAAFCLRGAVPPGRRDRPGAVPAHGGSRSPR